MIFGFVWKWGPIPKTFQINCDHISHKKMTVVAISGYRFLDQSEQDNLTIDQNRDWKLWISSSNMGREEMGTARPHWDHPLSLRFNRYVCRQPWEFFKGTDCHTLSMSKKNILHLTVILTTPLGDSFFSLVGTQCFQHLLSPSLERRQHDLHIVSFWEPAMLEAPFPWCLAIAYRIRTFLWERGVPIGPEHESSQGPSWASRVLSNQTLDCSLGWITRAPKSAEHRLWHVCKSDGR